MKVVKIAVIGLGYVGLPLAVEFSKIFDVIGYDTNQSRVDELNKGEDTTLEVSREDLLRNKNLNFSFNSLDIAQCNIFIVTVPTPVDSNNIPDLTPLLSVSKMLGQYIKQDDVVIYESTVYPGATEDVCIPVIEEASGLKFNRDFFAGYSPERINPGDKINTLTKIKKITSGSTAEIADFVDDLYLKIITAGTYKAESIKVAEAAKVIENTQRDINIALMNELSMIFNKIGIDTLAVLKAAGTKWNFLPFRPGLVGGHCISVDPYYLTHKAQQNGYIPDMILAGRKINDGMGSYVALELIKKMIKKDININRSKILIMGFAFKENCPDTRNTKVIDVKKDLESYGTHVDVTDYMCDQKSVFNEYGIDLISTPLINAYDAVVLAVPHERYVQAGSIAITQYGNDNHVFFDMKSVFTAAESDIRL